MRHKFPPGADGLAERAQLVQRLNKRYRHHGATAVLEAALGGSDLGRLALVSSFGAESVVLLHLTAMISQKVPILFVDTQMLFAETLTYQMEVAERLGLQDVRIVRAGQADLLQTDPQGDLHLSDPDRCCDLRKTQVLQQALSGFDTWITGRKRFQSQTRAALEFFELEAGTGRIKVNPMARWSIDDVRQYMEENRLPRHPLVNRGYPSIGCAPCTSPVKQGENPRAGRWRGKPKQECGIHLVNGRFVRTGENA